ncbi:MAG: hypothetical protein HKO84_06565, partial [Pseudomonadales bacterium]|nr:hypothetical protein [Pseudomonadales bacterium]
MTKALDELIAQYRARLEKKLQQLLQQQRDTATSLPAQLKLIDAAE